MARKLDWETTGRQYRVLRNGSASAYDELPAVGSFADRSRYFENRRRELEAEVPQTPATAPRRPERPKSTVSFQTLAAQLEIAFSKRWPDRPEPERRALLRQIHASVRALLVRTRGARENHLVMRAIALLDAAQRSGLADWELRFDKRRG